MNNIPKGCKPFNLQEALAGKPVVTRDGRKVKIAAYNPEAHKMHEIIGWADSGSRSWYKDGSFDGTENHGADLFMAPETKDVWVVLLSSTASNVCTSSWVKDTEQDAKQVENKMIERGGCKSYGIHKITITV